MGKPITLTWQQSDGKTIVEDCTLLDEDDKIFWKATEEGVEIDNQPLWKFAIENMTVVFGNDEGVFMLKAHQIISIMDQEE